MSRGRGAAALAAAAIGLVYLWFPNLYPAFLSPNELSRALLTRALVEEQSFRLDAGVARTGEFSDLARFGGHYYSDKAPGVSLAAAPVWAAWRRLAGPAGADDDARAIRAGRLAVVTLPALLFLAWLARRWSAAAGGFGLLMALGLGLGSAFFAQALALTGHVPAAMLLFLAAWCVAAPEAGAEARAGRWAAAGLLGGAAVLVDYTSALFVGILGVVLVVEALSVPAAGRRAGVRSVLAFAGAAALPLGVLLLYHAVCFGGPFELAYEHMAQTADRLHRGSGFFGLGAPRPEALWGLTFGALRGLFTHSPFLLLAAPAVVHLRRAGRWRRWHTLLAAGSLGFFAVNACLIDWQGGWSLGPRYLVPLYPFLLELIVDGYRAAGSERARAFYRLFGAAAVTWAVLLHLLAVATWSLPPHWSVFRFPALELSWHLLRHGALAPNFGLSLGLPGWVSLLPVLLVVLAALAVALPRPRGAGLTAAALGGALLVVAALGAEAGWSARNNQAAREIAAYMGYAPRP